MSEENLNVVRRIFAAANAGDFEAAMADVSKDVVLNVHGDVGGIAGPGAVGREEYARWFTEWFRNFERGYRFEIIDARAEGDRVSIDVTHHARGRLSGADVTMESRWVFLLRDGEVVRADGDTR